MSLTPRLVVAEPDAAISFYREVFGARLLERFADPEGHVAHAALALGDAILALSQERPAWNNSGPETLGGSPVILNLIVDDVDAVVARFLEAGGTEIFPLADQFYGHREGRFRDPFGHVWMLTTIVEKLSPEEIEARMRELL